MITFVSPNVNGLNNWSLHCWSSEDQSNWVHHNKSHEAKTPRSQLGNISEDHSSKSRRISKIKCEFFFFITFHFGTWSIVIFGFSDQYKKFQKWNHSQRKKKILQIGNWHKELDNQFRNDPNLKLKPFENFPILYCIQHAFFVSFMLLVKLQKKVSRTGISSIFLGYSVDKTQKTWLRKPNFKENPRNILER